MKQFILALTFFLGGFLFGQNNSIAAGEKLVYTATYNMSGILTDIAEVKMETSEIKTSKSTLLRLKCTAATYKKWDDFFKIRDLYESYVNPKTLTPYLYKRDISEGGYYKFMQYKFSPKTQTVQSLKRKKRKDGTTWDENNRLKIGFGTKDFVSTFYYIRTLDIHKAQPGDEQTFTVLFDNEENKVGIKFLAKEIISSNIGNIECYKLAVSLKNKDLLKGADDNLIWLSADENKIPIYATFKIPVGNGELKIKSASGLKH